MSPSLASSAGSERSGSPGVVEARADPVRASRAYASRKRGHLYVSKVWPPEPKRLLAVGLPAAPPRRPASGQFVRRIAHGSRATLASASWVPAPSLPSYSCWPAHISCRWILVAAVFRTLCPCHSGKSTMP